MLPDVPLIEIFDFYVDEAPEAWSTLVHVCKTWRNLVFGSSRRLNLRLYCSIRTQVREKLDVWPNLPIVVENHILFENQGVDNIVAALEHNDRICETLLTPIPSPQLGRILTAMQQPFPALKFLWLGFMDENEAAQVEPDLFLGGSAPHLQTLHLDRVPFPGLPKLLLSATDLIDLKIWRIPHSGYISPEAMVASLSVLTRLDSLEIGFNFPRTRPDRFRPSPPTCILLPALTHLCLKGAPEYLEDFVTRIDVPLLNDLELNFFHQLIFDAQPNLTQFISRTPNFKIHDKLHVIFSDQDIWVILPQTFDGLNRSIQLKISCSRSDWQLSSLVQACISSFLRVLIPAVQRLYIYGLTTLRNWQDDIESCQWLELLQLFTAVEALYISKEFSPYIATALRELIGEGAREGVMEVLPALRTLFLEPLPSGPVQEAIGKFAMARQLANYPIEVSQWEGKHF